MNVLDPNYEGYYQAQLAMAGGDPDVLARELLQRLIFALQPEAPKPRGRKPTQRRGLYISKKDLAALKAQSGQKARIGRKPTLPWPGGSRKIHIIERDALRARYSQLSLEVLAWLTLLPYGTESSSDYRLVDDLKRRTID